jgi:hypothetical protein
MNARTPPTLAVWLLRCLRYFEYNEALAGDLQEEFASGRSRRWYWRQTLMAIGRAMRHNLVNEFPGYIAVFLVVLGPQLCCVLLLRRYLAPGGRWHWLSDLALVVIYVLLLAPPIWRWLKLPRLKLLSWQPNAGAAIVYWTLLAAAAIAGVSHTSLIAVEAALAATILIFVMWRLAQCPKPEPRRVAAPIYWGRADEIALQVELTDGRVVFLRPENLVESVFAAGDTALTNAIFGSGASLETLRRALWLGNLGREQPVSLSELPALVQEAGDKAYVQQAFVVRSQ